MGRKLSSFCIIVLLLASPNMTALATGNFVGEGLYWNTGPNLGATISSDNKLLANGGIETSLVRLDDSMHWQGAFLDWTAAHGFGGGFEMGYSVLGLDLAYTQRSGYRVRFLLTMGLASVYIGRDKSGRQFGTLVKLPVLLRRISGEPNP